VAFFIRFSLIGLNSSTELAPLRTSSAPFYPGFGGAHTLRAITPGGHPQVRVRFGGWCAVNRWDGSRLPVVAVGQYQGVADDRSFTVVTHRDRPEACAIQYGSGLKGSTGCLVEATNRVPANPL